MRTQVALVIVGLAVALGTYAIRRAIIANDERIGREQFGEQIAAQLQQLQAAKEEQQLRAQRRDILQQLLDSLQRNPRDTSLLLPIGSLMIQVGDTLGALAIYKRYLDSVNPSNVVALTDYAFLLYATGDRQRGRALTLRALRSAPRYQIALYNMAVMEYDNGNLEQAIAWMERCREVDSTTPLGQMSQRALDQLRAMRNAPRQSQ